MTHKIKNLNARAGLFVLFCLMTAAVLVSRADDGAGTLPTAEQKAQGAGHQYAAAQAAKKDLADETCTEYGDHDAALPEKNPLDSGCLAVNREIVQSSPAGANPSFNPGLKQPEDPHNPYAAPQDEAKAYNDLVEKVKGPQGRYLEGDKEKQDEEKFGVYTRYISRPDGAKLTDTLTESNYWEDFVLLVTSEGGDELRIITRRASQAPTPSDTGIKPPLKTESIIFEPNVQGPLSFAGPEGYSLETPDENYKYVYFYHQLLRSWLKP